MLEQICGIPQLDSFFKDSRAINITTDRIREFITKRQHEGAPNSTINRSLAALRRMFSLAKEDSKVREVPHVPMLKEPPARRGFLEHSEFQQLRQALPEHLRPVVTLGFYTGMRLGEIKKLRWENINLGDNQIRLDPGTTKNDEARVIPLMGELPPMLKILRKSASNSDLVFVRKGKQLVSFRKAWLRSCVQTGLGKVTCRTCETILDANRFCSMCNQKIAVSKALYSGLIFHDLRRTGVRNLVRAGVPERVAQAISGHKTRAVFERYNIVSERDLTEAGNKLERYLADRNGANSGQAADGATAEPRLIN